MIFALDAPRVSGESVRAAVELEEDDDGGLFADDQRAMFTACIDGRRPVAAGEELELAVDVERMHFFDPHSGAVISSGRAESTRTGAGRTA